MTVDLVIPWRDTGCPDRRRAFEFITNFYEKEFSSVIISDSDTEEFNRAAARNRGVEKSSAEIVVVTDSDLFVPMTQITEAVEVAETYNGQVRPFTSFGHLSRSATDYFLTNWDYSEITYDQFETYSVLWPGVHGGTFVIRKNLWTAVDGMDEDFIGWGGEDNAFNIRCESRLGNPVYLVEGYAFHMFHPYPRRMSRENSLLLQAYLHGIKV